MTNNTTTDSQAKAFTRSLYESGWRYKQSWSDGGHTFELLQKGAKGQMILIQTYPRGHGFEVWRPVTESNTITETEAAVKAYGDDRRP